MISEEQLIPYAHHPALLLPAPWVALLVGAPQHTASKGQLSAAGKIREESCQFQELPRHHQTS